MALLLLALPASSKAEHRGRSALAPHRDSCGRALPLHYADLQAAGCHPAGLDPRTITVTNRGTEVAIRVLGEADGRFDPGDVVLFYARAYSDRFTNDNVYWLSAGRRPG